MDELRFIGYAVSAVITLGAFIAVISKFSQPINELRVVIQRLIDSIDNMKKSNEALEKRVGDHDDKIEKLDNRVGKLETRVDLYHKQ